MNALLPEGVERSLLAAPQRVTGEVEIYSGVARLAATVWGTLVQRRGVRPSTVFLFVHPTANFFGHYALAPLAQRGLAAVGMSTRYSGNDSNLRTENCLLDIGSMVSHLRSRGYRNIILVGNSGGAGIVPYYQAQAAAPSVSDPPGGGPDLTRAELPEVDAVVQMMAHSGRARLLTEWLDPAIIDERSPFERDPELDLYAGKFDPPYDPDFVTTYRAAQVKRNRRITQWAETTLNALADDGPSGLSDLPFVVYGTYADPRVFDGSIDPSDRELGTSLWGPPEAVNYSPPALGRYTTSRSWLNQWSLDHALGDSLRWLPELTVPVHVLLGTADTAANPVHGRDMYAAATSCARTLTEIPGATHYFAGQTDLLGEACDALAAWAEEI